MYEYQYGKGAKNLLELIALSKQQQAVQAEKQKESYAGFSEGINAAAKGASKYGASKLMGALGLGGAGSAAVTTQGAAGYPATAAALPELFGGTASAAPVASAANMSLVPQGGVLSSLAPTGSAYAGMGTLGQIALPVAGVLGAKQIADNWGEGKPGRTAAGGAAAGAAIGSVVPGIGTLIGALVGGAAGGLGGLVRSGKHEDAVTRDHIRDQFVDSKLSDKNDMVEVSPGKFVSLGKDTSSYTKYKDSRDYDLFNKDGTPLDPVIPGLIPKLDPFIRSMVGDDQKRRSDATGLIIKAALATNPKNEAEALNSIRYMMRNTGYKI